MERFLQRIISSVLARHGDRLVDRLRQELIREGKQDTGELIQSIQFTVDGLTLTINMVEYAQWVDQGRSPNSKFPPVQAIRGWVQRKGLRTDSSSSLEQQQRSLAYLIGRKIARDGIPPTNFIDNAITPKVIKELENDIVKEIEDNIEDYIVGE